MRHQLFEDDTQALRGQEFLLSCLRRQPHYNNNVNIGLLLKYDAGRLDVSYLSMLIINATRDICVPKRPRILPKIGPVDECT